MDHGKISDRINRASGEFSPLNENPERSNGWMDGCRLFFSRKENDRGYTASFMRKKARSSKEA